MSRGGQRRSLFNPLHPTPTRSESPSPWVSLSWPVSGCCLAAGVLAFGWVIGASCKSANARSMATERRAAMSACTVASSTGRGVALPWASSCQKTSSSPWAMARLRSVRHLATTRPGQRRGSGAPSRSRPGAGRPRCAGIPPARTWGWAPAAEGRKVEDHPVVAVRVPEGRHPGQLGAEGLQLFHEAGLGLHGLALGGIGRGAGACCWAASWRSSCWSLGST